MRGHNSTMGRILFLDSARVSGAMPVRPGLSASRRSNLQEKSVIPRRDHSARETRALPVRSE
ncbi:MAG: hypothetical protein DME37_06725 [Verrucomicrobia bacterium]|nr:MAG: hypothetical protein DME37_06725 [Verrucomicrobiota bacterium]